jgi:hypothetical protein
MPNLITSRSCLQVSYFFINCSLHRIHFLCATASETNQTLLAISNAAIDTKTISGTESETTVASSSSNVAAVKIAKKDVPMLTDYWKKSTVAEEDRAAYHTAD